MSLALLCLLAAAPRGEVVREEAFNYRVVGVLPTGWKRREQSLHFTYEVDGIPLAHVDLGRQRVRGALDLAGEWSRRLEHYRFPGAGEDATEREATTRWADREALLFDHEARLRGVACRRRVTALWVEPVFFELIETVYGEGTAEDPACREGLELFRAGFELLVPPLAGEEAADPRAGEIVRESLGYRLRKPSGFVRKPVDLVADPGCRLSLESVGPGARQSVRVRLFEYGLYQRFEAARWLDIFHASFAANHTEARRAPTEPGWVEGAGSAAAETFTGRRGEDAIATTVVVARSGEGRVFALHVRSRNGAPVPDDLRLRLD